MLQRLKAANGHTKLDSVLAVFDGLIGQRLHYAYRFSSYREYRVINDRFERRKTFASCAE
jgi:hypothetical protein